MFELSLHFVLRECQEQLKTEIDSLFQFRKVMELEEELKTLVGSMNKSTSENVSEVRHLLW